VRGEVAQGVSLRPRSGGDLRPRESGASVHFPKCRSSFFSNASPRAGFPAPAAAPGPACGSDRNHLVPGGEWNEILRERLVKQDAHQGSTLREPVPEQPRPWLC